MNAVLFFLAALFGFALTGPLNRAASGSDVGEVGRQCVNQMYAFDNNGNLLHAISEYPSYRDIRTVLSSRMGTGYRADRKGAVFAAREELQTHHIVPKYLQEMLQIPRAAFDDCPGLILTASEHQFPNGIHGFLVGIGRGPTTATTYTKGQIFEALEQSYLNAGRPEIYEVAVQWLATKGIGRAKSFL